MSLIVQGFSGIGKTTLSKMADVGFVVNDLDFSKFKIKWPSNYIQEILNSSEMNELTLCSTHSEVFMGIINNVNTYTVYPSIEMKSEMMERYVERNYDFIFIDRMNLNYDKWVKDCMSRSKYTKCIELKSGQFLSDVIEEIV